MRRFAMVLAAGIALAGCTPDGKGEKQVSGKVIFDASGPFTFTNHFEKVPDPAGGGATVFKTSDKNLKMTFVNKPGFFAVPAGHKGAVVLRLLVRKEKQLRVIMVGPDKHRSYYLEAPVEGKWFELELPLEQLKKKVAEGQKVVDVTVWLMPPRKGAKHAEGAEFYCSGAVLRQ